MEPSSASDDDADDDRDVLLPLSGVPQRLNAAVPCVIARAAEMFIQRKEKDTEQSVVRFRFLVKEKRRLYTCIAFWRWKEEGRKKGHVCTDA